MASDGTAIDTRLNGQIVTLPSRARSGTAVSAFPGGRIMKKAMGIGIAGALVAGGMTAASAENTCAPQDPQAIVNVITALYDAAMNDDEVGMTEILAPRFYAFDAGHRFDGMTLPNLIKAAHKGGRVYRWSVTLPDVHVGCHTAWIAYVNDGAVGDTKGTARQQWLESANLDYVLGQWRVVFLSSMRVPPAGS
jgi:hypothetical protein